MNLLAFFIGIALPVCNGWLLLLLLERRSPVLGGAERWFWALILGPTFFALTVFVPHVLGLVRLDLVGFLSVGILTFIALATMAYRTKAFAIRKTSVAYAHVASTLPRAAILLISAMMIWTGIKTIAGVYDLVSVPTYWDDSFNNWNMRGKMFFVTSRLQLEIPVGNGTIQSAQGVGSYPPSVPMLKAWLASLRGSWEEPLVNGLHVIWLVGLAGFFFFVLRRRLRPAFSLGGVYLLLSLPLLLIQATNPYADVFLASHLLIAVSCLFFMAQARSEEELATWLKLFGLALGLTLFTKNEATLLYSPTLILLCLWILMNAGKSGKLKSENVRRLLGMTVLIAGALATPWLAFKWLHGLTFGNAKSVSGMHLVFDQRVVQAVWFHLSHEPNWLFLPLLFPLALIADWKRNFTLPYGIFSIFAIVTLCAQFFIFALTPLATEAIQQTGLSRGLLHLAPIALLCVIFTFARLIQSKD